MTASPSVRIDWRRLASGSAKEQAAFAAEVGCLLGRLDCQPPETDDAIAHWMKLDRWPPRASRTRPTHRPASAIKATHEGQSANAWNATPAAPPRSTSTRPAGKVILQHTGTSTWGVSLVLESCPPMDAITATTRASQTASDPTHRQPRLRRSRCVEDGDPMTRHPSAVVERGHRMRGGLPGRAARAGCARCLAAHGGRSNGGLPAAHSTADTPGSRVRTYPAAKQAGTATTETRTTFTAAARGRSASKTMTEVSTSGWMRYVA